MTWLFSRKVNKFVVYCVRVWEFICDSYTSFERDNAYFLSCFPFIFILLHTPLSRRRKNKSNVRSEKKERYRVEGVKTVPAKEKKKLRDFFSFSVMSVIPALERL